VVTTPVALPFAIAAGGEADGLRVAVHRDHVVADLDAGHHRRDRGRAVGALGIERRRAHARDVGQSVDRQRAVLLVATDARRGDDRRTETRADEDHDALRLVVRMRRLRGRGQRDQCDDARKSHRHSPIAVRSSAKTCVLSIVPWNWPAFAPIADSITSLPP